jgi:hypothetical protein
MTLKNNNRKVKFSLQKQIQKKNNWNKKKKKINKNKIKSIKKTLKIINRNRL